MGRREKSHDLPVYAFSPGSVYLVLAGRAVIGSVDAGACQFDHFFECAVGGQSAGWNTPGWISVNFPKIWVGMGSLNKDK